MINLTIWVLIAILLGCIEAILFDSFPKLTPSFKRLFKFDIHLLFTLVRMVLVYPLAYYYDFDLLFIFICSLVFPFFHDGVYYISRRTLSLGTIYPKGFFDKSTSTTALLSFSFFWRLILFIFGAGMSFVFI